MYTDDEQRTGIPLKTFILSLILVIIFILLLMWLLPIPKYSNNNNGSTNDYPNINGLTNRIFNANVQEMKNAATSYFTTDKLPQREGDSVRLTLQEMLDMKLLLPFTDKDGNACDTENSYVLLTKNEDSYEMKVNLSCNTQEDYILVTMGCYSYCTSTICEKNDPTPVKPSTTNPTCSLYVSSGTQNADGSYKGNVVVKFRSKTATASGTKITTFGMGTSAVASFNQNETYTVSKDGTTTVYGYVKDSNGKTGICSLTIRKGTTPTPAKSDPTCSLYVSNGTLGSNGWYTGNVVVKFKSKTATASGATITTFGLGTSTTANYNKSESYTVTKEGTTTVYGYVKDSNGKTAVCSISIKKDSENPSCSLTVLSGTKGSNGSYVSDVVVGFASNTDATSGISSFGLTTSTTATYNNLARYTITTNGTHKIYGYVKDKAGHVAKCDIKVTRNKPVEPITSTPSCSLKVTSGTTGANGWYTGNVVIGFASKKTTNGATIKSFGIGSSETYAGNTSYTVSSDGTKTIYGYVKDSNGYTATCSITVKRDATKPACSLKVTSGTLNSSGYYTSNVVIGFASKTDSTSGINGYGIGTSTTYGGNKSYTITATGRHTIYGYVKDNAGNTATCSITIEKRDNLEYQYKKDIAAQYSQWTNWTTSTYNPSKPPSFGKYPLIEIEDLGKTQEVDYYKESTGEAFYKYKIVKVGTATQTYCKGYTYYRDTKTQITYAVSEKVSWQYAGMVTTTGWPTDTMSVKYEFVGFDWKCTGCERTPKKIWNKYTRTVSTATSSSTIVTSGITTTCAATETKTIEIFDTVKIFVDYEIIRTPVYKDVYHYRQRTRTLTQQAYTDYKWSVYNDTTLLNNGYTYTGATRVSG